MKHDRMCQKALIIRSAFLLSLTMIASANVGAQLSAEKVKLTSSPRPGDVTLVAMDSVADLHVDANDFKVVRIATDCLAADVERVTGKKPRVKSNTHGLSSQAVIIGTIGKSALVDDLIRAGKLDVASITGQWESFVIASVSEPSPGVDGALVIAGSDRRGTAYGVFTLSEAIGVSPWYWWADVPPVHHETLAVKAGTVVQGPPSVKYRGIFINDEDWGLQEWAEKNFESGPNEVKDMGPKTYAKVFELLLRLKANLCWPAMHPSTKAFNHYPENKVVADDYAIVMGSSHAEPMLRNNVDEWDRRKYGDWNPVTNLKSILGYWEERTRENGKYENVHTVGMRGVHDSGMPGGGTLEEKRERLERIIGLQRELLAKYVNPDPSQVPQIFCPYKEVLDIYQSGMDLPEDVTIVWPDDNHGYIRQLPNEQERKRSGGHGVYYHISYWGRPHDYLWLESTSPALIWEEMTKAYNLGARRLWVLNVGDIKPMETGMTFFMELAWDINSYGPDAQQNFLNHFYSRQFGEEHAQAIAALKDEYFRLTSIRRPEHLGFNRVYYSSQVKNQPVQDSDRTPEESQRLLDRWLDLAQKTEALGNDLPGKFRDAYFQLVEYPARAAAAMAGKLIKAEQARQTGSDELARQAKAAFNRIEELTKQYNAQNDGKWRAMMDYKPRDLPVFGMPPTRTESPGTKPAPQSDENVIAAIDPTKFAGSQDRNGAGWRVVEGLGPRGAAIVVLPFRDVPTLRSPQEIRERAPVVEYAIQTDEAGEAGVTVEALPTHPVSPAHEILAAVSINDGEPVIVSFDQGASDEGDPKWQKNVLRHAMIGTAKLNVPKGKCTLKLWAADRALVVQRITLDRLNNE